MTLAYVALTFLITWPFYVQASDTYGQSFPTYFLQVVAMSVAMAWLYWRTRRSLIIVMVLHAAANDTKDIVPSLVPGATQMWALSTSQVARGTVALLWVCAIGFLIDMRGVRKIPV